MNSNEKLQEVKEKLENCANEYNSKLEKVKELEKIKEVIEYKLLSKDLELLRKQYDSISKDYMELYESNCEHPLWYFMADKTDDYEQRQLWQCKCIKCGKMKREHSRFYKDKLIIESGNMGLGERCINSFEEVKAYYDELSTSEEFTSDEIKEIMIKKYNKQKTKVLKK